MKFSFVSDSLSHLSFESMLDVAAQNGLHGVEINTSGFSSAVHFNLPRLRSSPEARTAFRTAFETRGLEITALNANGNPLHPTEGKTTADCLEDTIRIAGDLGIKTVVAMSGLPGGAPGDTTSNWVTTSWPPEGAKVLRYQWEDVAIPYWTRIADLCRAHGVEKIAIEIFGAMLVYNVPTMLKLRAACGPIIGANLDPSHLFWMGADPLAAIDALGSAVHHVHAKDTWINPTKQATTSLLETGDLMDVAARSWSYITLGYGHSEDWWRAFCYRLRLNGYDGWLSIEHEDVMLSRMEGLLKSIALLRNVAPTEISDFKLQDI